MMKVVKHENSRDFCLGLESESDSVIFVRHFLELCTFLCGFFPENVVNVSLL